VSFVAITLCVASQRVFIVVGVYFVIDLVLKLFVKSSYIHLYYCLLWLYELTEYQSRFTKCQWMGMCEYGSQKSKFKKKNKIKARSAVLFHSRASRKATNRKDTKGVRTEKRDVTQCVSRFQFPCAQHSQKVEIFPGFICKTGQASQPVSQVDIQPALLQLVVPVMATNTEQRLRASGVA
jgi:hypothetical protein